MGKKEKKRKLKNQCKQKKFSCTLCKHNRTCNAKVYIYINFSSFISKVQVKCIFLPYKIPVNIPCVLHLAQDKFIAFRNLAYKAKHSKAISVTSAFMHITREWNIGMAAFLLYIQMRWQLKRK